MEKNVLMYSVTLDGRILALDGPWDEFARENGAIELEREKLVGRNLFHYITSTGVIEVYKTMHRYLHEHTEKTLEFDYRCDSPHIRRYMRMVMKHIDGAIQYTSSMESTVQNEHPIHIRYQDSGEVMVRMCSWCKRIKYPENSESWSELSELFAICPDSFTLTHGICVDCRGKISYLNLGPITF